MVQLQTSHDIPVRPNFPTARLRSRQGEATLQASSHRLVFRAPRVVHNLGPSRRVVWSADSFEPAEIDRCGGSVYKICRVENEPIAEVRRLYVGGDSESGSRVLVVCSELEGRVRIVYTQSIMSEHCIAQIQDITRRLKHVKFSLVVCCSSLVPVWIVPITVNSVNAPLLTANASQILLVQLNMVHDIEIANEWQSQGQ